MQITEIEHQNLERGARRRGLGGETNTR